MKKIIAISILTLISFNSSANDNAKRLIELIITEDVSVYRKGGRAMISDHIPLVNASQLINEYENNQYKYEKTYDKQLVNIKTVASGVKTDLSGDPYVVANGKNQLEYVSLELKNKDDAMNINKGNKLDLICIGTKNNVMYPILKNCVTADSYFHNFLETAINNINELKQDDEPSNRYEAMYLSFWDFDKKNPNELNNYETIKDISDNKANFNEIMELAKSKVTEKTKEYTMPKP